MRDAMTDSEKADGLMLMQPDLSWFDLGAPLELVCKYALIVARAETYPRTPAHAFEIALLERRRRRWLLRILLSMPERRPALIRAAADRYDHFTERAQQILMRLCPEYEPIRILDYPEAETLDDWYHKVKWHTEMEGEDFDSVLCDYEPPLRLRLPSEARP